MIAPVADVAELSRTGLADRVRSVPPPPAPTGERRAMREQRRRARRQRRLNACLGLALLAVLLCATVLVVDMVR